MILRKRLRGCSKTARRLRTIKFYSTFVRQNLRLKYKRRT